MMGNLSVLYLVFKNSLRQIMHSSKLQLISQCFFVFLWLLEMFSGGQIGCVIFKQDQMQLKVRFGEKMVTNFIQFWSWKVHHKFFRHWPPKPVRGWAGWQMVVGRGSSSLPGERLALGRLCHKGEIHIRPIIPHYPVYGPSSHPFITPLSLSFLNVKWPRAQLKHVTNGIKSDSAISIGSFIKWEKTLGAFTFWNQ